MERNGWFFRIFFLAFALIASLAFQLSTYLVQTAGQTSVLIPIIKGLSYATLSFAIVLALEYGIKKVSIQRVRIALLGLALGIFLGIVVNQSLTPFLARFAMSAELAQMVELFCFLACVYSGILLTTSIADESSSQPLASQAGMIRKNESKMHEIKKNEILIELSALEDPRLIELARSGILDHQLIVPSFVAKEIHNLAESQDENSRLRAKKCLEHLKRLETMQNLGLRSRDFICAEQDDMHTKLSKAARLINAYIIISHEVSQIRSDDDATQMISLEALAAALKPGAQRGEILTIKIQRLGKEPKQGVGYLEDSTMVVVNGGGEFLGQTIRTQVLSQKYSSSGKIIFCNAITHDEKGNIKQNPMADVSPYHLTYQ